MKWTVNGVTYGPFLPDGQGQTCPEPLQVDCDFAAIAETGANTVRLYNVPAANIAEAAGKHGLRLLIDIPWPKHLDIYENPELRAMCLTMVKDGVTQIAEWNNVLGIILGNEIPADIVRWHGARVVERFLLEIYKCAKEIAPDILIGFANFPSTEYLNLNFFDFIGFNVYLDDLSEMREYLVRLRHLYPEKPVLLTECGADSKNSSIAEQAELVPQFLKNAYDTGLTGAIVFAWTDEWHTGGVEVTEWDFGLVDRDRNPKPALKAVTEVFSCAPRCCDVDISVSLVIASYNGAHTLRECLESVERLNYANYETIVVDDGSTDNTEEILQDFPWVQVIRQENKGLSAARNAGINAASGDIIAFTDSDCVVDSDWLYFIALYLQQNSHLAGLGGPNITPLENRLTQKAVALAPGHATHVLLAPSEAEHVPGCNMAFWRATLVAAGGFDTIFKKAGDDVDVIWRLQNAGYKMGFSTAAFVWHHRRPTIGAYLKQQRGYGEAEALLLQKHPARFNDRGQSLWRGMIYPGHGNNFLFGRNSIQYGVFGAAGYQCIYHTPRSLWWYYATSLEWWVIAIGLVAVGFFSPIALVAGLTGIIISVGLSGLGVLNSWQSSSSYPRAAFPLVWLLWVLHPLVRSASRYWHRLKPGSVQQVTKSTAAPSSRNSAPLSIRKYWAETPGYWRTDLLEKMEQEILAKQWICSPNNIWQRWDLSVAVSAFYKLYIYTEEEAYGGDKRLLKLKYSLLPTSLLYICVIGALIIISPVAFYDTVLVRWMIVVCLAILLISYKHATRRRLQVADLWDEILTENGYYPTHRDNGVNDDIINSEIPDPPVFPQLADERPGDNA